MPCLRQHWVTSWVAKHRRDDRIPLRSRRISATVSFPLRLQPELDQAADGFGAGWFWLLLGDPCIENRDPVIEHSHRRSRQPGWPSRLLRAGGTTGRDPWSSRHNAARQSRLHRCNARPAFSLETGSEQRRPTEAPYISAITSPVATKAFTPVTAMPR